MFKVSDWNSEEMEWFLLFAEETQTERIPDCETSYVSDTFPF